VGDASQVSQPDAGAGKKRLSTNVITLLIVLPLLAAGSWYGWYSYREMYARAKFTEAYNELSDLQGAAADEFTGPPRGDHDVAPRSRYVRRIMISPANRSIVLWLDPQTFDELGIREGAALRLTLGADGTSWACKVDGIPTGYVFAACRH
jgi:hypothetical protein